MPLLIKLPGQRRGAVDDRHVETIDILPTILELTGLKAPTPLDGRSLLRPLESQARRVTIFHRIGTKLNTVGGNYTFQVDDLERRWRRAVSRSSPCSKRRRPRPEALYRIGPRPELVGRRAASLPLAPLPATIDQAPTCAMSTRPACSSPGRSRRDRERPPRRRPPDRPRAERQGGRHGLHLLLEGSTPRASS